MRMTEERPAISTQLVFPTLLKPILLRLEKKQPAIAKHLLAALSKAEHASPGLLSDLVASLLKKAEISVNMTESLLRLQSTVPDFEDQRIRRHEEPFQELNKKCAALKKILSRIPDEINHRTTFLETIKEIASAIKKLLDCVNEISNCISSPSDRQALEVRKREFIRYSKKFSNTLKEFFKEGHAQAVYTSAAHLIHQTNAMQYIVKCKCDLR